MTEPRRTPPAKDRPRREPRASSSKVDPKKADAKMAGAAPAPRAAESPVRESKPRRSRRSTKARWLPALFGFAGAALFGGALLWGCRDDADESEDSGRARTTEGASSAQPNGTASSAKTSGDGDAADPSPSSSAASAKPAPNVDPDAPWNGPWLGATAFQTPVYAEPRFGDDRIGYLRQGAKVPVDPKPIAKPNCKQGWYKLIDGGYVCGKYATLDMDNPRVKLGVKAPDVGELTPYKYAYNRYHGTPLYRKPPSKAEVDKFEPYLAEEKAKKEKKKAEEREARERAKSGGDKAEPVASADAPRAADSASDDGERRAKKAKREAAPSATSPGTSPGASAGEARDEEGRPSAEGSAVPTTSEDAKAAMDAIAALEPGAEPEKPKEPEKAWWQIANETGEKPSVTLADMAKDSGGSLEKRMAKGFFVAVDKTVGWEGRSYFRTTNGFLAPMDRMWLNKPPESKGVEFPKDAKSVFFVLADKARLYDVDTAKKKAKDTGPAKRFSGHGLTGDVVTVDGTEYKKLLSGSWIKSSAGTFTEPGKRPEMANGPSEKWVDVNLDKKTLVLFVGDEPVYAALVSPGKRSKDKKKNHATKEGVWRIREKHVAVTMDGDGAGGDLPYSIDDVPFVEYYDGSYALHAAFWHSNFGREMSHGCVNLAPLDAKHVFNWTEPRLPRGWHAVNATKDRPGTVVSIHGS
jgi:hypothetical protein